MRLLTWYNPSTDSTYSSFQALNDGDYAIENKPQEYKNAKYNPKINAWEQIYEEVDGEDYSIGEIDQLIKLSEQSDDNDKKLLASLLLKLLNV